MALNISHMNAYEGWWGLGIILQHQPRHFWPWWLTRGEIWKIWLCATRHNQAPQEPQQALTSPENVRCRPLYQVSNSIALQHSPHWMWPTWLGPLLMVKISLGGMMCHQVPNGGILSSSREACAHCNSVFRPTDYWYGPMQPYPTTTSTIGLGGLLRTGKFELENSRPGRTNAKSRWE